jgi:hypothetical protein
VQVRRGEGRGEERRGRGGGRRGGGGERRKGKIKKKEGKREGEGYNRVAKVAADAPLYPYLVPENALVPRWWHDHVRFQGDAHSGEKRRPGLHAWREAASSVWCPT